MHKAKESSFKLAKKQQALELANMLENAQGLVVAEYRGLTVAELNKLRREAEHAGVSVKVLKNRIFKYALKEANISDLAEKLVGPNIYLYSTTDGLASAKLAKKFADNNKLLVIKAGIFENRVLDANGVLEVASLPNYEEALAILGRALIAPVQQLSIALKLYSEQLSE
ncbi:50S ribosomal protein L10 [Mycoplasmopsis opalescens]|uniref:50S ribosomal protein L10 n=1 Tax=Mycoplasmopsis opalescens TaxID=114886 RepID=UPI0004A6FBAB|nr:50S ribosomal protein L10 [Mycoplasmopsis opalescens]